MFHTYAQMFKKYEHNGYVLLLKNNDFFSRGPDKKWIINY